MSSRTRPTARQKIKTKTRKEVASKKTRFRLPQTRGPAVHIGDDSVWRGPLQPQDTALRRESGSLNVPQRPKRSTIPGCLLSMTGERDGKDHDRGPESVHENRWLRSVEWAGGFSGAILHFFDNSFFCFLPFFPLLSIFLVFLAGIGEGPNASGGRRTRHPQQTPRLNGLHILVVEKRRPKSPKKKDETFSPCDQSSLSCLVSSPPLEPQVPLVSCKCRAWPSQENPRQQRHCVRHFPVQ